MVQIAEGYCTTASKFLRCSCPESQSLQTDVVFSQSSPKLPQSPLHKHHLTHLPKIKRSRAAALPTISSSLPRFYQGVMRPGQQSLGCSVGVLAGPLCLSLPVRLPSTSTEHRHLTLLQCYARLHALGSLASLCDVSAHDCGTYTSIYIINFLNGALKNLFETWLIDCTRARCHRNPSCTGFPRISV